MLHKAFLMGYSYIYIYIYIYMYMYICICNNWSVDDSIYAPPLIN